MILSEGKILYHGSYTEVKTPDIAKCADGKDFGRGFYVTTDRHQAERFVKSSVGKAVKNGVDINDAGRGYVSEYFFSSNSKLKIYEFSQADREWLHCVVAHRKKGLLAEELKKWDGYDIIVGKIANDNTNQVITAYINGLYGEVGSKAADDIAINLLIPERLTDQICFKNQKAISSLGFKSSKELEINGK